jgi:hypothetical protein
MAEAAQGQGSESAKVGIQQIARNYTELSWLLKAYINNGAACILEFDSECR